MRELFRNYHGMGMPWLRMIVRSDGIPMPSRELGTDASMSNKRHRSERDQILDRYVTWGIIIGALLGVAAFVLTYIFPMWQPVTAPPEKPAEILAYHSNDSEENTLYIRTSTGNIYNYGLSSYWAGDAKWRKVDQVNQEASGYECNFGGFATPIPPGTVISQLESHPCIVDAESQVDYVLLQDGSIWRWEKTVPEWAIIWVFFGLVVYVFIGCGLGVIAGLLIGFVNWKFKKG
jgi:hypothetical protein